MSGSRVIHATDDGWAEVDVRRYKDRGGPFLDVVRHTLLGGPGAEPDLAFEVTSAFGTVGLSRGATGELDGTGLAFVMLVMFVGRVGPLALGFFLATRSAPRVRYPEGQIYLG